jgi:hypothetical protein
LIVFSAVFAAGAALTVWSAVVLNDCTSSYEHLTWDNCLSEQNGSGYPLRQAQGVDPAAWHDAAISIFVGPSIAAIGLAGLTYAVVLADGSVHNHRLSKQAAQSAVDRYNDAVLANLRSNSVSRLLFLPGRKASLHCRPWFCA